MLRCTITCFDARLLFLLAIAEEERSHLVEAATPSEELVGGAFRDIAMSIEAGLLQTVR